MGPCPASSSRWAAWLRLGESDLLCTGTSKLENRGPHRVWAPGPGLHPRQQGKSDGVSVGRPGAGSTEPRPGQHGCGAFQVSPRGLMETLREPMGTQILSCPHDFSFKE